MAAISINLPDDLANEAKRLAERIGVSRTELIRSAVKHEIEALKAQLEREEIRKAFKHMRVDSNYRGESNNLDEGLNTPLVDEEDNWWRG
ncbi:MAG: ribbon-helix-helix protein, CopG family [Thiotrichales bacterium]